jgi:hypothetical protein
MCKVIVARFLTGRLEVQIMIIKDINQSIASRRSFLHKAMFAITGGTLLVQTNASQSNTLSTPKPALTTEQPASNGYHETEHIRNYYKSAGL